MTRDGDPVPLVVGIGGTARPRSTTERALRMALAGCEQQGARTVCFNGPALAELPHYAPGDAARTGQTVALVDAVRGADGVIVATPGYHGGVSGLLKNALDFLEDLRDDARPYWDGLPVGCIVTAHGWQACGSTLAALRAIVHALRGWPTPLGVTLNTAGAVFDETGAAEPRAARQLALLGRQVVDFAQLQRVVAAPPPTVAAGDRAER